MTKLQRALEEIEFLRTENDHLKAMLRRVAGQTDRHLRKLLQVIAYPSPVKRQEGK